MVPDAAGGAGYTPCAGGSPYNTAIAMGRLGADVAFLGRMSRDFFGETLATGLADNNVNTSLVVRSDQNTVLAIVKLEAGREPRYIFYTEGTAERGFTVRELPDTSSLDIDCVVFGSIALTMEPVASTIETFVERERQRSGGSLVVSHDPNIRPMMIQDKAAYVKRFERWAAMSTIVKVSEPDYQFIYPGAGLEDAMAKVLSMGPALAVTTLGERGALALLRKPDGTTLRVTAPVVDLPVADTIGAGDTFHGAFIARLSMLGKLSPQAISGLTEAELRDGLYFANKAASIVCSRRGADPPTLAQVNGLGDGR
jgi:fructokinase